MSDSAQQAKAQKKAYDEACKRVLSEREIMAHILKSCTEEFKDCSLLDIAWRYIQGEPSISRIVKSHYEKIQKVYSIWICTMPTKKWEYHISRYQLTEKHLIGHTQAERSHYDLISIVLVCLGSKSHRQLKGILRLLNMLLLDNISPQEKQKVLAKEFNVTMTPHLEKGVATMCNLSESIERRGERRGEKRGRKLGEEVGEKRGWDLGKQDDVLEMLKDGVPFEKIAQYTKLSLEAIADIAKQNKLT